MPNAIDTLSEALELLHGIDYDEESRVGRAVALLEDAKPRVEALLQAAEDVCARNPAHLTVLAAAVRKVKEGTHEPRGLDVIEAGRREEDERA